MPEVEQRMEQLPATAWTPEVEQRMEQLPNAQERPLQCTVREVARETTARIATHRGARSACPVLDLQPRRGVCYFARQWRMTWGVIA